MTIIVWVKCLLLVSVWLHILLNGSHKIGIKLLLYPRKVFKWALSSSSTRGQVPTQYQDETFARLSVHSGPLGSTLRQKSPEHCLKGRPQKSKKSTFCLPNVIWKLHRTRGLYTSNVSDLAARDKMYRPVINSNNRVSPPSLVLALFQDAYHVL